MIVDPNEDTLPPDCGAAAFYAQMGRAIAHWAKIENGVFELFHYALVTDKQKAAFLFERLGTLGPRIEITDKILKMSVQAKWYAKWAVLKKDMDRLINVRNQLAHNPVVRNGLTRFVGGAPKFEYYSQASKRKLYLEELKILDIGAIQEHNAQMLDLTNRFWNLGMPKRARKRPEAPVQRDPLASWVQEASLGF